MPPFGLHERNSIEWAKKVVAGTGSLEGLRTLGKYTFGTKEFEVLPEAETITVDAYAE